MRNCLVLLCDCLVFAAHRWRSPKRLLLCRYTREALEEGLR